MDVSGALSAWRRVSGASLVTATSGARDRDVNLDVREQRRHPPRRRWITGRTLASADAAVDLPRGCDGPRQESATAPDQQSVSGGRRATHHQHRGSRSGLPTELHRVRSTGIGLARPGSASHAHELWSPPCGRGFGGATPGSHVVDPISAENSSNLTRVAREISKTRTRPSRMKIAPERISAPATL